MKDVDIAAVLDAAAAKSGQKLDWRHSIVDLMKAVGMDASLAERRELADELGYHRMWMAEHHGGMSFASSAPAAWRRRRHAPP